MNMVSSKTSGLKNNQLPIHTPNFSSHLNPKVEANHINLCKFIPNFPQSRPNLLLGHFPCYAMTSGLLMIGGNLSRPAWFLPLLSCPLLPRPWHPSTTHASDVIPPDWGGAAISSCRNSLNLWCCYAASGFGLCTGVSQYVCLYVSWRGKTDQGECTGCLLM